MQVITWTDKCSAELKMFYFFTLPSFLPGTVTLIEAVTGERHSQPPPISSFFGEGEDNGDK